MLGEEGQAIDDNGVEWAHRLDQTVEASALAGVPHRAALVCVSEWEVELIVVGTHDQTGGEAWALRATPSASSATLTTRPSHPNATVGDQCD